MLGFLYGVPSERQIEQRCADSNAFRWYLGIDLDEQVPDHSTISQLRRRKPSFRKVFRRLFEKVVRQCKEKGQVSGGLVAADSSYDSALVQHELDLADIVFYTTARKTPDNTKMELGTDAFSYEEGDDVYRCPNGKVLALRTLYRSSNGLYWVYRAESSDCRQCTMRGNCLCDSHQGQGRRILRNYFEAAVQSGRQRGKFGARVLFPHKNVLTI